MRMQGIIGKQFKGIAAKARCSTMLCNFDCKSLNHLNVDFFNCRNNYYGMVLMQ